MSELVKGKANFGTAPVFLTAISTIPGAVMFLRFGFVVDSGVRQQRRRHI